MEKKEKVFYKKWWFWIIMLLMVAIVSFSIIVIVALGNITSGVSGMAIKIQKVYSEATIYGSAGENTLILELKKWDNSYSEQFGEMIKIIKTELNNDKLQSYNKLIIVTYLKSNEKDDTLLITDTYNLPDFTKESEKTYINFNEYKGLYNTLDNTMDSYTNLFNSMY